MITDRKITIIGGGLAGLSAAVFLSEKGFSSIELLERTSILGGRASSYYDTEENCYFDYGQHLMGGWYENTFEFLRIINSFDNLFFQKSFRFRLINPEKKLCDFSCSDYYAPFNIISGFLKYKILSVKEKINAVRFIRSVLKKELLRKYCNNNLDYLLKVYRQSDNIIKYFWEPLIFAVFNAAPKNVSAGIFSKFIRLSLQKKINSSLVFPKKDLYNIFVKNSLKYFEDKNTRVILSSGCREIIIRDSKVTKMILENGKEIYSDYIISAVPFNRFSELFTTFTYNKYFNNIDKLKSSTLISIYIIYKEDIPSHIIPFIDNMLGLTDKNIQWIFKISPNIISLTISAADYRNNLANKNRTEIFEICRNELYDLFRDLAQLEIRKYRVIKSGNGTFIPDADSVNYRIPVRTKIENFFVIGDWADTGLPSTIESAVKSARMVTDYLTRDS